MKIETEFDSRYLEVFRGLRSQLTNLIDGNYQFQFSCIYDIFFGNLRVKLF